MANIGSGYSDYIGQRASTVNPQVQEFYNTQTGTGFSDPNQLAGFVNQQFAGSNANASNVFGLLQGNYAGAPGANANTQGNTVAATGGSPGANPAQPPNPPSLPGGMGTDALTTAANNVQNLTQNAPSTYDLYQQELKSRGIDTLTQQEADLGNSANAQEAALKPLLPENVAVNFPKSLQQLQDVGVTQDQLNLLAAKERAPIASGLADLLKSQSVIAQQIDRQTQLSQYVTGLKANDYQTKLKAAQDAYTLAADSNDRAAKATAAAQLFATTNNITTPYYNQAGTVVRTSDGYQFTSETDFKNKTGLDVGSAESAGLIQKPSTAMALKDTPTSYQEYTLAKQEGFQGSYNDYQTMDANRKAVRNTTINNTVDTKRTYDLQVAQAPAQVATLKAQGKNWGEIANYFQQLGIDPGTKEIDDALHREFMDQAQYKKWKANG